MKRVFRETLAGFGLLDPAIKIRDYLRSMRLLKRNFKYLVQGAPDGLPLPPIPLIVLVIGISDIAKFLETGRMGAEDIRETLAKHGLTSGSFDSILDFGCGCGRVIRWMKDLQTKSFFGVDYNQESINWCKRNLPFATFETNSLDPPLHFDDSSFDFIYAASVFTHFTEERQELWMRELRRVLRPDGHLLITTHGDYFLFQMNESDKEKFLKGQLVVTDNGPDGSNWIGAYHPKEYVSGKFSEGYKMVEFLPRGAKGNPSQDIYLFRNQKID